MAQKRKQKQDSEPKQLPKKKRRFRRVSLAVCFAVLAIVAALGFFAPTIVANTSLRQLIVPFALPDFQGKVTINSASLGWFSPMELTDVQIVDLGGGALAEAKKIASEKTLWQLLWAQSQYGKFTIDTPRFRIQLTQDSSNLEQAIAPYMKSSGSDSSLPQFTIDVQSGVIKIEDAVSEKSWSIEDLDASVQATGTKTELLVKLASGLDNAKASTPRLSADVHYNPSSQNDSSEVASSVSIETESLELALLQPLLRRFSPGLEANGTITGKGQFKWSDDGTTQSLNVDELQIAKLDVGAVEFLGGDRLVIPAVTANGALSIHGQRLVAENLKLACDLARLEADGELDLQRVSSDVLSNVLQEQDYRITGEIDLALLAKAFPQTLRIREGTHVTSGKVSATLHSRMENENRRWSAVVETANVTAVNDGQPIRWDQPIHVTLFAGQTPSGAVVDHLTCKSSFLQIDGRGSMAEGGMTATGDLDRLAVELAKFVNLDGYQFAGNLTGSLNWGHAGGENLSVDGKAAVTNFALVIPGALPWREQKLTLILNASGKTNQKNETSFASADLRVESAGDVLDVRLTEPVSGVNQMTDLPLKCQLVGKLTTWLPRVQTWLPTSDWQISGDIQFDGTGTASSTAFDLSSGNMSITDLQAVGNGFRIREPDVRTTVSMTGNLNTGVVNSKEATLISSSVSLRTADVKIETREDGVAIGGRIAFLADLDRLSTQWQNPSANPMHHFWGKATGKASLAHDRGVTLVDCDTTIENFIVGSRRPKAPPGGVVAAANTNPWQAVWQEKQLRITGNGDLAHATGDVHVKALQLKSESLTVSTKGKLRDIAAQCATDLSGEITYDLKTVAALLRPYIGSDFDMEGKATRDYALRGPLFVTTSKSSEPGGERSKAQLVSEDLGAQTSLSWASMKAHGFKFGPGELNATLDRGVVKFDPLDLPVNQGRVKLAPQILLNTKQVTLAMDRGQVIDKVQLTPEMCHTWLKYVAPMLADATVAKGEISMSLEGVKLPLASPTSGTIHGALEVHGAKVGPGPLGQQIESIAQQVISLTKGRGLDPSALGKSRDWLELPEQTIKYHLSDGKVYHEGLELVSREVTIRTRGYVGLDQTLALTVEIPIRDEWVANNQLLSTLKGKTLEVPIRGTLTNRVVDKQVLTKLGTSMLGGAIEQKLGEELKKGLQGLFGPRK